MNIHYTYSILRALKLGPTNDMVFGTKVHKKLEKKFMEDATSGTFEEVVEMSQKEITISREVYVISPK